jgi:hypothetical protein
VSQLGEYPHSRFRGNVRIHIGLAADFDIEVVTLLQGEGSPKQNAISRRWHFVFDYPFCLINELEVFTRLEANCFAGGDADFGTRTWVSAYACFARFYGEHTEAA